MVQIIDNLTALTGVITDRRPHPGLAGHDLVTLRVERAERVEGRADLLAPAPGDDLPIAVRSALLGDARPPVRLHCRARRATSGWIIAEQRPAPAHFSLAPIPPGEGPT